jgi:class 3 adenylate cyclase/ketosteroid isomerase-like protein/tetratricopeptide (TPR) repeat protein
VRCSGCGQDNREGRKFCGSCGVRLTLTCAACGEPNEPGERFCGECGGPLLARPGEVSIARKIVTIVFADLAGSTALHERLDPESAALFMDGYYRAMRGAVEAHGGSVTQLLGDGVKAEFGVPAVAEDDAIRAVRAAVAMQDSFRVLARQHSALVGKTGLRIAVNTGEVVAGAGSEIIGDPVNVAARLQERARDGDVVIGETTHSLVASLVTLERLGTFHLKGRAEPVTAYRVVSLDRPERATAGVFVGRDDELARIGAVQAEAVAASRTRLAVVLGSPGLGKSRLVDEVARRLGAAATVIAAHCDAAGGATFAPVATALRALLRVDDGTSADAVRTAIDGVLPSGDDAERARVVTGVATLLAGSPAAPEETFFVVRRFLAALAATRPVVLVIDDLHWAEPLLLDLVEHLVQWGGGVPLLLLVGARPELRDLRATLCTPGGLVTDVITLHGLDAGAAMRLAANVIGAADLPATVAAKVLATSEGNPLFVGELVRMLVQEGALTREGERWTTGVGLASLEMPPTIHALLAARIERLRPEDRSVLERAAVVGRHFSRSAVAALLPDGVKDLDVHLESLTRSELIERDPGWMLGEPALRFHHVLIRDAAYRRILKGTRAELHAQLAGWIAAQSGESSEHDETIGRHLEQAYQHLGELGPIDQQGRVLGERASRHLGAAGRRALARDDVPLAAGLLGRALATLDPDDDARAELALDWCEALLAAGDVATAATALDELERSALTSPRRRAWHACFTGQLKVLTSPEGLQATADAVARATAELTGLQDAAGEATGHFVHAAALARLGRIGACEGALDRALAAARRAGDRRRANAVLAIAPLAALWGPSPVTRASGRCLDVVRVLRITEGAPAVEAVALSCQGVLEALRGRTDAARRMIAAARRMVEELGITQRLLEADAFAGLVDLLDGDAASAERNLRGAYDGLRALGLGVDAARAAALLARAQLALGRVDEAETLSHDSEALAGDDLKAASAWRGVRAVALARRGEHAAAIALATRAVEIAAATDALLDHADARVALATALRAAGRGAESDAEERRASELWGAKGATLLTERASSASAQPGVAGATAAASGTTPRHADGASIASIASAAADVSAATGAGTSEQRAIRHVRPNAATRDAERIWAAVESRDLDQLTAAHADETIAIHHPTGATYGAAGVIALFRQIWRATALEFRQEILASLGDALCLVRRAYEHDGAESRHASIGAVVGESFCVCERVEREPATRRSEIFAEDRLADAIARLYERHAELLPAGHERTRATATARSVKTMMAVAVTGDLEPLAAVLSPDLEDVDHRQLGLPSGRGAEPLLRAVRALFELAADMTIRIVDVLALDERALLQHVSVRGYDRRSGGAFELPLLLLWAYDDDGLLARWEVFDAERDSEALARFAEVTQHAAVDPAPARVLRGATPRRVRPNTGSAAMVRVDAALAACDLDAMGAFAASFEEISHPTGAAYGRDALLLSIDRFLRLPDASTRHELLATLGDTLWLYRRWMSASAAGRGRFDVGAYEKEEVGVNQLDVSGAHLHNEIFAADRLGDAVVNLYERHAATLPDGPLRARATATAAALAAMVAPPDLARYAAALSPSVAFEDHRTVGFASGRGADKLLRGFASLLDVASGVTTRVDDVLLLEPDALLLRWTVAGTDRRSGGAFESPCLLLWLFGADGRIVRDETFDAERAVEALARHDELVRGSARTASVARRHVRPNAATRLAARFQDAFAAADEAVLGDLFSAALEVVDHPNGATYGRDGHLASVRRLRRASDPTLLFEPLATLGEQVALSRRRIHASATGRERFDVGEYERDELVLFAVDGSERCTNLELFAGDHLGEAMVALYARYAAMLAAGAAHDRADAIARTLATAVRPADLDAWCATIADDFELLDHRVLGVGALHGGDAMRANFRAMFALETHHAVGVVDVLAARPDAVLARFGNSGVARDSGGTFERWFLQIVVIGRDGRIVRMEYFDDDRDADALARFDELTHAAELAQPFANAASAAASPVIQCLIGHDWEGFRQLFADDFRMSDRRRVVQLELDREQYVAFTREIAAGRMVRNHWELVATRGDRLAVIRSFYEFADTTVGPSEVVFLLLMEIDAHGRIVANVRWDPDDVAAAHAEIDLRYDEAEGAARPAHGAIMRAFTQAVTSRDWNPLLARCAPEFVEHDHRGLAVLGTTRGAAAWAQNFSTLVDLAPDTVYRNDHFRSAARGFCSAGSWVGSRDGAHDEIPLIAILEVDTQDRLARADIYDQDELDQALARFTELGRNASRDARPTIPRDNAATALADSWQLFDAGVETDWDALRASCSPDVVFEDRQGFAHVTGDRELMIASLRERAASGSHIERRVIALAGERVAVTRMLWSGGPVEGRFEIEYLGVTEVDASGRLTATILFSPDDEREALREAWSRWAAIEPDVAVTVALIAQLGDAWNARDLERIRALCAESLGYDDHRRTGIGRLDGIDAYIASLDALWRLAPATSIEGGRWWPACTRHGGVAVVRRSGTVPGGGPFESEYVELFVHAHGCLTHLELFELEDVDQALARLEELRPDPLRVPLNAASRIVDRQIAFAAAGEWAEVAALHSPDLVFDDRRRGLRTTTDGDAYRAGLRWGIHRTGVTRTILATAGDRLELRRNRFTRTDGDILLFEVETLALAEIDVDGRLVAVVLFDIDDRAAAHDTLFEHWAASAHCPLPPAAIEHRRAWNAHDFGRIAALVSDDFVCDDHRLAGFGRIEGGKAYAASVAAYAELSPDLRLDDLYQVAVEPWGRVAVHRTWGTNREGGVFETVSVVVALYPDGRLTRLELFEPAEVDAAIARFSELGTALAP